MRCKRATRLTSILVYEYRFIAFCPALLSKHRDSGEGMEYQQAARYWQGRLAICALLML
jgi:hypothetical protein